MKPASPVRVLRVIARMNVGGPAHNVSILSGRLDERGYETLLVAGRVGPGEASADHLAHERKATLRMLETLTPEIRPWSDLRALVSLIRIIRRFRPAIVHTHTAKAGFVGRLAAAVAVRPRPLIVHTYHGHVLSGYFGRAKTALYRGLEQLCGRFSDALIGVSDQTVDELVAFRIAPREKFRTIPLGLDLDPFAALPAPSPADEVAVTVTGRLVPIKRVDLALDAVARARGEGARLRLTVVGDGELRPALEEQARTLGLGDAVRFAGFRPDMPGVVGKTDIALLTSDNEGTPVALIEAAAGGRPAVATEVGGVAAVVSAETGRLCPPGDAGALAVALAELAADPGLRDRLGAAARDHVLAHFGADRLVYDVDRLYRELLT
jgi:glycosyltransferase involved in cell wall biosynthesis